MKVSAESVRGKVQGLIYGSKLESIKAIGRDSYETTLSLDARVVDELITRYRNSQTSEGSHLLPRKTSEVKRLVVTESSKPSWNFKNKRWEKRLP